MLSYNFKRVVKFIYSEIKNKDIIWAIVGSANMALQGIDIEPKDIDIITTPECLIIFSKIFRSYITKPICKKPPYKKGYPEFYELKLNINDTEVHLFGEEDTDVYFSRIKNGDTIFYLLDGYKIPCLSLKSETGAYEDTHRGNKAEIIRKFLKEKD